MTHAMTPCACASFPSVGTCARIQVADKTALGVADEAAMIYCIRETRYIGAETPVFKMPLMNLSLNGEKQ